MSKVIILNGPPGVGKDTIANRLSEQYKFFHLEVKAPLYYDAYTIFKIKEAMELWEFIDIASNRDKKEEVFWFTRGYTIREALIYTSEEVMKKIHGKGVYGNIASDIARSYIRKSESRNLVFSDGGFIEEVEAIAELNETILVRLHRDGFTFDGDSRSYVRDARGVEKEIDITLEEGNVQFAVDEIAQAAGLI